MEIFRNSEWVVTHKGIEAIGDYKPYWIEIDRVFEKTERGGIGYYDWPIHLAEKEILAVSPFIDAFDKAIRYYAKHADLPIDEPVLERTYRKAIKIAF